MAVVINNNSRPIMVREIKKIIPCDGKFYVVPESVAFMYKEHLLIIPPVVVLSVNKLKEDLKKKEEELELERKIIRKEKALHEKYVKLIKEEEEKIEKSWIENIKKTKFKESKIDVLYSFHFDDIKEPLKRLKTSINSLKKQNVNICVCNTSKQCIHDELKKLTEIKYYHKSLPIDVYCKPQTINLGVNKLVTTPYFILSDIDLIYQKTFINELSKYVYYPKPSRVMFRNYNLEGNLTLKTINEINKIFNKKSKQEIKEIKGPAPGNGLIHLESFNKIGGYDEEYVGYGLEDGDFNLRISFLNKLIHLDDDKINSYHLFHKHTYKDSEKTNNIYKQNVLKYKERRHYLLESIGDENINFFNEETDLNLIKVNT